VVSTVRYCVGNVAHPRAAVYALRTLLEMVVSPDCLLPGTDVADRHDDEVWVAYGTVREGVDSGVRIFASGFFDCRYGSIEAMPRQPVVRIECIPALYSDSQGRANGFFSVEGTARDARIDCRVDIVAGTFFMLSRYEEVVVPTLDAFKRFPVESSVAYQEGFLQEPVVNEYAEQALRMLRIAGFTGERRRWWGTAPWAIALTHDVDRLHRFPHGRPPILEVARSLVGRAALGGPRLRGLLDDYLQTFSHRKADEFDCLEEVAAWELSAGIHAGYYFLGDSTGQYGADYVADATDVVVKMKTIESLGHEVGFHAGFWAYTNADLFHGELSRLQSAGVTITGGRQHYLRWQTPTTWRLWECEGLAYDATLGYSSAAGFRCGTCFPFHPYDIENDREMAISEWPLMFMDATFLSSWSEGAKVLNRLSEECSHYGGVLVLLWHNGNWSKLYAPVVREHFRDLLQRCVAQGVAVNSINGLTQLCDSVLSDQARLGTR
jgi:hypothetical protein